ncbi:recombinase family protein [Lentibacillus salicampi]|uniref:Recombinase family protein n=1 Tax=Lentibacillus salicampi TaxID=175306 RepID=A0A4Y9ACJ5_9BACI|nr:recombinase family protein [Lentibacillus salicampi]TFJ93155.1 recombinase family protein [Lentibacillus salicampi]
MRAALYVRVSTEEQNLEGYSIEAQKNRCMSFIESQGDWYLSKVYADPGHSAKNLDRPAVQELMEGAKNKEFDVLVVYRLDRLVRSVLDLHNLLELFDKHNVKFKSVTEVFDTTTAMGRFFITLVGAMSEWERSNLSERVSFGMEQMTREGKWKGGHVGYGHMHIDGHMAINEDEARIVRMMYDWYLTGMSDRKIAKELRKRGIMTRGGAQWSESHVRYTLSNPKNKGDLRYGIEKEKSKQFVVEDIYPQIIDVDTFDKAMSIRESRRTFHGRQATSDHYFSGILTCSRCGRSMVGHMAKVNGKRLKNYVCLGRRHFECDMPSISERIIEHNFLQELRRGIESESINQIEEPAQDNADEIKALKRDLNKIKDRRKKWQYAWANEIMSDTEFQDRMQEEQELENDIQNQLNDLDEAQPHVVDEAVLEMMSDAVENWGNLESTEKKQLMQIAFDKIIVDKVETKKVLDRANIIEIVFK